MVNTRTDAELAAAVQAAVDAMLPQIREQVREEYRAGASGGNPPPVTIHTWLERFNKQKPRSFEKAVAPVDAENWISHIEKIFDVMDCNDVFKTRLAVYKFEGDALAWWKAYKQAKGGDAWVLTLTWAAFKELFFLQFFPRAEQERLKREYHSIRQRASENSTEYMQRFLRLAGFLGQAAGTAEEQAKNFRWGLHKSILDHVMCIQFTDVAQVADAARNLEILRDRDDYERSDRSDKRHKSGDRYHPYSQQGSHRSHGQSDDRQRSDRQGSDRQSGGSNYRNNNNSNHSRDNNRNSGAGRDQRNRGPQSHRSTNSGSQQSRVPSEGYTHPVCNTCGRRHPGECRRAAVPFLYNPDPCFDQNFDNNFPLTSPNLSQQYLCCENCGGPHETFQCQPLNQNFYEPNYCYNSNSSGFDQYQPSHFSVIHHPPQKATVTECCKDRCKLMETIQAFLKEYDHIPPKEKCMALLLAEERFLKIKQAMEEEKNQPEVMQELLLKLMNDLQILNGIQPKQAEQEEPVAQSFLLNWNFPMADDDEYTIIYRKPKAITPDLPTEEPDNSLSMGDEHLNTILETEKSSVENLVPIPSESKGISDKICDVPFYGNDHFDAEFGLINSLLSRDISITSHKIDFLPEEFVGELDLIDLILPGIDDDDFDEEEGEIDIDILQIEDEILREKLLNVNLLIDKIEELNLTPSIPYVLEYPSSSPIPVVDSNFLIEEVDTFLALEDSIPPGIEIDFDSEGDIIFNDLLNNDPIPEYERFTFDIEPDAHVINNFDELNEDECFDPGGGKIDVSQNIEDDNSFAFVIQTFLPYRTYPVDSPLTSPGVKTLFLTPSSPLRAGGISSGWNFHTILVDEGFEDVNLFYLGGKWVMFEFDKVDTKVNMMKHIGVNSWFQVIQDVIQDFVSDERVVWVDSEGIPLHAWSRDTFTRIRNKWGETLNIEDTIDSSFGRKRLCISTKHPVSILESFKIIAKGKVFMVRAKELFTWNPIFLPSNEKAYSSEDESARGENSKEEQSKL
ncbi:zinc finger, CCHC-type, retrotransposon gag domain protein [Tanacetum coccineum]